MLAVIMKYMDLHYQKLNQEYLGLLYCTIFLTMYFGLFRISEVVKGDHAVLAKDIHLGKNKNKILFVLRSSKTHSTVISPQLVKITSTADYKKKLQQSEILVLPCPFELIRSYLRARGGYSDENEQLIMFRDGTAVPPGHIRKTLKLMIKKAGFDHKFYRSHSLRAGRSCDLFRLGVSIENIKKLGHWKSNDIYRYLKS